MRFHPTLLIVLILTTAAGTAAGQNFCDDPPSLTVLTGDLVPVSGLSSEGHPSGYSWYITPPGAPVPGKPTSTNSVYSFSPDTPGLWSVALVAEYEHSAAGGGLWSSDDCITIRAASVVASIHLASNQVATDEDLQVNGFGSQWAPGVTPLVEWQVDGQALGSCNGGPPPSSSGDLTCTIPANWLTPGWHTAGLLLTDPSSAESSLATADFEVIEIIPLSVDFSWTPAKPDPGQLVLFSASVTPTMPEGDYTRVIWDFGDGEVVVYNSCPPPYYHTCLEYPYTYTTDGWYDVSVTVETIDETASKAYQVEIGDPVALPIASFTPSPSSPMIMQTTDLIFDGSCESNCQWDWDLGDGTRSILESPTHAWTIPATYTVSLTIANEVGSDATSMPVDVNSCWLPVAPTQDGSCYGGPVILTAVAGSAWSWSTGATTQTIAAPQAGAYWVNINDGAGCWGHAPKMVVLDNCGDPDGDTNLDGATDAVDISALIPELTDGDGDTVVGAGGGDLTAPGGDVTGDDRLRPDDLLMVLVLLFE